MLFLAARKEKAFARLRKSMNLLSAANSPATPKGRISGWPCLLTKHYHCAVTIMFTPGRKHLKPSAYPLLKPQLRIMRSGRQREALMEGQLQRLLSLRGRQVQSSSTHTDETINHTSRPGLFACVECAGTTE